MIAIIEGCGANIASVQFALARLGKKSVLTHDPHVIQSASHVILPGVGTAQCAIEQLNRYQLLNVIRELQQPVLGICLGMQLLYEFSCENAVHCLNLISGEVVALPEKSGLTIPHMGWNQLEIRSPDAPLLKMIKNNSYVYFVHGYAASIGENTLASTQYGNPFSAIVHKNNFYGVQFHPERSGQTGATILKNFLEIR